ncbi:MAG: glycine cleavage system aminomethyltransferase GcvT [Methanobacteriota archaeon]|nr:MAG: glycine cleavage system aminomethyltransferase GcvT [Euryarchaeota archaeon]
MANLRTPLFEWHTAHGARVVEFGGWDMPLQYTGIVEEHLAVRRAAGLFDVSHMGKLLLEGAGTSELVNRLSTNDIPAAPGRARYTHLLDERGRILDDVIFTCLGPDRYLCVCNAGPRPRIVEWIHRHLGGQRLTDLTPDFLCLALQGPRAAEVLGRLTAFDLAPLRPFRAAAIPMAPGIAVPPETVGRGAHPALSAPGTMLATRTGYTGEDGFELFPPSSVALPVWEAILRAGGDFGIRPVGLGARDTLRLEKGYLLSGQDFTGSETSLETSSEWLVKWDHTFVGREALLEQKRRGGYRRLVGLKLLDRGVPRHGHRVLAGGREVGLVTSGTLSPSLRIGIALGFLEPESTAAGTGVAVDIRGEARRAEVVMPPFL